MKEKGKKEGSTADKVLTWIGIALCVILVPILIINCTMIIKSYINKDEVPSFFSMSPMIVLTDSMYPGIKSGDLIIVTRISPEDVGDGDVISFFDPASKSSSVVTHRVVEIVGEGDTISFRTKGDNNNTNDRELVPGKNLVGKYRFRIPGAGNAAMFMQTTPGLLLCVALPVILLVGYDMIRRRKYEKSKADDTAALLEELERLRAEKNNADNDNDNNNDNNNKNED